jgi:hypothetical protein
MGPASAVAPVPAQVVQIVAAGILFFPAPAPGRVLPLSLGGQAEGTGSSGIKLGDEALYVIPAHLLHRIIISGLETEGIVIAAHDPGPLALGHLVLAHPEPVQADLVHGKFITLTTVRPLPAPHVKAPRHPYKLHTGDRVGPGLAGRWFVAKGFGQSRQKGGQVRPKSPG